MLDTACPLETPEGVSLELAYAGPVARGFAWAIDMLVRMGIYTVTAILLSLAGKFGNGLWMVIAFLVEWFYPVIGEVYGSGATIGKRAMGIKVVLDNGAPISWGPSMVRNLVRFVDFLPFANGIGMIACLSNAQFKRLGDLAAGTVVVHHERRTQTGSRFTAGGERPPLLLELPEQKMVVAFAERSERLSAERREELADLVQRLTGASGQRGVDRLMAYASWLMGKR